VRQPTIKRVKLIGYQVLEASDGPIALEILKRGDAVDLVFTDLIMRVDFPAARLPGAPAR
jgi:CheY-like chemotaxis protein